MVFLNKKGQIFFYTIMLGLVVILIALALVPALKQFSDDARSPSSDTAVGLDCSNTSISNFQQAQCIITDLSTPYFFMGLIALAGMIIGAKVIMDGTQ